MNRCRTKGQSVPDDEVGPGVDHRPLLVQHVFLLMCLDDVMFLHLLQSESSPRFIANLYLSVHVPHTVPR